jgi:methionyl aminopeptidase
MEKEVLEKYKKAGKIAAEAKEFGLKLIKPGALAIEIVEDVEKKIFQLGGKIAFPVNFSINDIAAHWTPVLNDITKVKEGEYVKLDIGVQIDGYIADTASTVKVGMKKDDLIICSEKMLEEALKLFKPGTTIGEIGEAIENAAKEFKFNPIRNLTGHSLNRHDLHSGAIIPNIKTDNKYQLRENEVYACEPFCTPGNGFVKESGNPLIFRWINDKPCRIQEARKILELARTEYERLPFAKRWIQKIVSGIKVELALKELLSSNSIYGYPILREISEKNVAQSEHTIIVREKPIITTKLT